jgi:hypothetical protein
LIDELLIGRAQRWAQFYNYNAFDHIKGEKGTGDISPTNGLRSRLAVSRSHTQF